MTIVLALKLGVALSIVLMLFALSLRARFADLGYMIANWREGLGALIAMFVIVPSVAIALAAWLDISPDVKVALVALAFSPVPPVLPAKQVKLGASADYVTGLLILATLASIVLAPWGVPFAATLLDAHSGTLTPMGVAAPLFVTILAPLVLGLIARPLLGRFVAPVATWASRVGTALLLMGMLGLVVLLVPGILGVIGEGTLVVLTLSVAAGVVFGYLFGGRERGNRSALALAAATRHPGAAIAIATHSFPLADEAPAAIALAAIVSGIVCVPLLRVMTRP